MGDPRTIVVECPNCEMRIEAEVIADHTYGPSMYSEFGECRLSLAVCLGPDCQAVMLIKEPLLQQPEGVGVEALYWGTPSVLYYYSESGDEGYPYMEDLEDSSSLLKGLSSYGEFAVPMNVLKPLQEAEKCLNNELDDACAVLCRKAIEAICHAKNCVKGSLRDKLKELCEQSVIDSKLLDWAGEIKVLGDRGAHPYRPPVGAEESRFGLEFAVEVARYVFVLNKKYDSFKSRPTQ